MTYGLIKKYFNYNKIKYYNKNYFNLISNIKNLKI